MTPVNIQQTVQGPTLSLYTILQIHTKRSTQMEENFPGLHITQMLQGLAPRKLPLQLCATQAWLTRATCNRSEQSTANVATFPKMDTRWQSSRTIPFSHERGGRHVGNTCLETLSARERSLRCTVYTVQPVSLKRELKRRNLSGHFQL